MVKSNILNIFFPPSPEQSQSPQPALSGSSDSESSSSTQPLYYSRPLPPCLLCDSTSSLFEIAGGLFLVSGYIFRKKPISPATVKSAAAAMTRASAQSASSASAAASAAAKPIVSSAPHENPTNHAAPKQEQSQEQSQEKPQDDPASQSWQQTVKLLGGFIVGWGVYNGVSTVRKAMNGEYEELNPKTSKEQ